MNELEVIVKFSSGDEIKIGENSIIFPIKLVENKDERFCSTSGPIIMEDELHIHEGLIPALTTVFALNEFFYLDDDTKEKVIYKTSSIVSLKQREKRKASVGSFYR